MKKFRLKFQYLTLIISFGLLALIIHQLDWTLIKAGFNKYTLKDLFVVLVVYLLVAIIRSYQFKVALMGKKPNLVSLVVVNMRHNFYQSVLPAQSADLIYGWILKTVTGIELKHGNVSLFIVRVTDVLILSLFLAVSLIFIENKNSLLLEVTASTLLLLALLVMTKLRYFLTLFANGIGYLIAKFSIKKSETLTELADELSVYLNQYYTKQYAVTVIFTGALAWFLVASLFILLFNMLDINIGLTGAILLVALVNLAALLPISSVGGIGVREPALIIGLLMLGYNLVDSSANAILVRLPLYLLPLCLGAIFLLNISVIRNRLK